MHQLGMKKSSYAGLNYIWLCDWNLHWVHQAWLTMVIAVPGLTVRTHRTRCRKIARQDYMQSQCRDAIWSAIAPGDAMDAMARRDGRDGREIRVIAPRNSRPSSILWAQSSSEMFSECILFCTFVHTMAQLFWIRVEYSDSFISSTQSLFRVVL